MEKPRLRDYIITKEDLIFSVVSYDLTRGVKGLLRYVPDRNGERERNGIRYRKLGWKESYSYIREKKPEYLADVHLVPFSDVKEIISPLHARIGNKIKKIFKILFVPRQKIGLTGSYLLGLNDKSSDVDVVVYGDSFYLARENLKKAKKERKVRELTEDLWKYVYKKRSPSISYEEFLVHEIRKNHRGMIDGNYFDLLFVRDWSQIEGYRDWKGKEAGRKEIVAEVKDVIYPFDLPATYKIDHEFVKEILCYTHTYIAQAFPGETIKARGELEISEEAKLIVGSSREAKGEWIKSITLLEDEGKGF
jgi:hypothetical protein